jgi:hypothetical protein
MQTLNRNLTSALFLTLLLPWAASAQAGDTSPSIASYTEGMDAQDGYFPMYWDDGTGRLLLEIPRFDESFLYMISQVTGIGSNPLLLDRGTVGPTYVAHFERVGPKVLLVYENTSFRAETDATEALARSVEESFPTSVAGAFEVLAEEDGRALVDATPFFLRDAQGIARRLAGAGQGNFRVDAQRSVIHLPRTRAFPINTEIEASLTFTSESPGPEVRRHTPESQSMTLREHHSFVQLPDDGFTPRRFDPRVGVFAVGYYDFGRRLDQDYQLAWARRHRLEKADPEADMSEAVEPIIYYLDRAVPEPYRSAFVEGGEWWSRVFEAAGFIDAFRVEDMPDDMDPMDARYNVIQWVHRTDAGSSVGPSFVDPRTGEIIKAAVRMDSYRSLANYNTYAGMVGVDGDWYAGSPPGVDAETFTMMRRRQHSAHEIGHTLGLAHNFISISDGHASVMDYPAPVVQLRDGAIDLSEAYRAGPGAYDSLAIRYAYAPVPGGQAEDEFLNGLMIEAQERGWRFITNPDAGADNAHPDATWWVNGTDMLDEFARVMEVRSFLIESFDERAIEVGEPMHKLQQRFAPVYFSHRATYEAAIKSIGGMEYRYGVRGDPEPVTRLVEPERVRGALDLVAEALAPESLQIPERILELLAPRSFGWAGGRPSWQSRATPAFDQVGAARTLVAEIVGGVLHPRRAARVVAFNARDGELPTLEEVIQRLVDEAWMHGMDDPLARVVQRVVVDELIGLAANDNATVESRVAAEWGLMRAAGLVAGDQGQESTVAAHSAGITTAIQRYMDREWSAEDGSRPLPGPGWSRGG